MPYMCIGHVIYFGQQGSRFGQLEASRGLKQCLYITSTFWDPATAMEIFQSNLLRTCDRSVEKS